MNALDNFRNEVRNAMRANECDWTRAIEIVLDLKNKCILDDPKVLCNELGLPEEMENHFRNAAEAMILRAEIA